MGSECYLPPGRADIPAFTPAKLQSWAFAHRGKWDQLTPWKMDEIKKRKHAKKSSFLCLCYILRAIRAGRCREWRYADHIFFRVFFRMHHFVVEFEFSREKNFASGGKGALTPLNKILRTILAAVVDLATRSFLVFGIPQWFHAKPD